MQTIEILTIFKPFRYQNFFQEIEANALKNSNINAKFGKDDISNKTWRTRR